MNESADPHHLVIIANLLHERRNQDRKWGEQHHPDGTSYSRWALARELQRTQTDLNASQGVGTWLDILLEETYEAAAEEVPSKLRAELVQVMAVAGAWIEDIDSRRG